jgi:hypothetical protein
VLGVRDSFVIATRVTGLVVCVASQSVVALRSYVRPSGAQTGSTINSKVMGQTNSAGISVGADILDKDITNNINTRTVYILKRRRIQIFL